MKQAISAVLILVFGIIPAFADYKLTQQRSGVADKMTQELTVYAKGMRTRSQGRMIIEWMPPQAIAFMKVAEEVARQVSIEAMKPELKIFTRAK